MFIHNRNSIYPVDRIAQITLYHTEHLTLIFHCRKCRKTIAQNTCRIRNKHYRRRNVFICLCKIFHRIDIRFKLLFIRNCDIF